MRQYLLTAIFVAATVSTSSAQVSPPKVYGEYSHNSGIAFSLQRDPKKDPLVAYDVVSAWSGKPKVADCTKWKVDLKASTWCFSSEANLTKFHSATDKDGDNDYLPTLGGHCALGTSWGYPGPKGDPTTSKVYRNSRGDRVLVLQSHPKWVRVYDEDAKGNYKIAEAAFNVLKASGVIVPNDKVPPPPAPPSK